MSGAPETVSSAGRAASMAQHLEVLTLLQVSASALTGVVVTISVLLGFGAVSIAWRAGDEPTRIASALTASLFFATALGLALWAGARYAAARGLRRHAGWARLTALAVAVLDLFLVPFGTVLSLYALWVLMHPDVRPRFRPH
jgi:DNA-binding IclR family transcriptional regulator